MTKSEVQEILDDADTNNDGKLDYNEVCAGGREGVLGISSDGDDQKGANIKTPKNPKIENYNPPKNL